MNNELKPCPFCGGKAKIYRKKIMFIYEEDAYMIYCKNCQAQVRYSNREEIAIEEWNRRTKDE